LKNNIDLRRRNMRAVVMDSKDNVATLLRNASAGDEVIVVSLENEVLENIILPQDISAGHKFALIDIVEKSEIVKYGEVIGYATKSIKKNEYVHTHNMESSKIIIKDMRRRV